MKGMCRLRNEEIPRLSQVFLILHKITAIVNRYYDIELPDSSGESESA